MAKVTVRKETGKLVIDFTYRNVRCREQTALSDTLPNRKRVQAMIDKIQKHRRMAFSGTQISFRTAQWLPGLNQTF